jgi:hypothetical protein
MAGHQVPTASSIINRPPPYRQWSVQMHFYSPLANCRFFAPIQPVIALLLTHYISSIGG